MRVTLLGSGTQTHIPIDLRIRHAKKWAEALEGMADKLPGWTLLEEGRSKLLLMDPPAGMHVPTEIAARTRMWQNGQYTELLTRIEAQAVLGRAPRRQSQAKRT
jgi:hypothetical protein